MLWACLLLPSLPLDVFARAVAPDARAAVRRRERRPLSARRRRQRSRARGRHSPRPADFRRAGAGTRRRDARARPRRRGSGACRSRDAAARIHAATRASRRLMPSSPRSRAACGCSAVCRAVARQLQRQARSRGYDARIALAPTPTAALLLARAGRAAPVLDRDGVAGRARAAAARVARFRCRYARDAEGRRHHDVRRGAGIAACGARAALRSARRRHARSRARPRARSARAVSFRRRISSAGCRCLRPSTTSTRSASASIAW